MSLPLNNKIMIEFMQAAVVFVALGITVAIWLGIFTYAISSGWHKAKTEYPTTINYFTNPPK